MNPLVESKDVERCRKWMAAKQPLRSMSLKSYLHLLKTCYTLTRYFKKSYWCVIDSKLNCQIFPSKSGSSDSKIVCQRQGFPFPKFACYKVVHSRVPRFGILRKVETNLPVNREKLREVTRYLHLYVKKVNSFLPNTFAGLF